jgi:hypothetical protein
VSINGAWHLTHLYIFKKAIQESSRKKAVVWLVSLLEHMQLMSSFVEFLSNYDVMEYLVNFLTVEDVLSLTRTSIGWRVAVNLDQIWRRFQKIQRKENCLTTNFDMKYRNHVEEYKCRTLYPLCQPAFCLVYSRYLERKKNDFINQLVCGVRDFWYFGGQT